MTKEEEPTVANNIPGLGPYKKTTFLCMCCGGKTVVDRLDSYLCYSCGSEVAMDGRSGVVVRTPKALGYDTEVLGAYLEYIKKALT